MTEYSPITPTPELVQQWQEESLDDPTGAYSQAIVNRAAAWGSDQELEACCQWFQDFYKLEYWMPHDLNQLRAARRPKPSNLKKQALIVLDDANLDAAHENILRRALEALPDD